MAVCGCSAKLGLSACFRENSPMNHRFCCAFVQITHALGDIIRYPQPKRRIQNSQKNIRQHENFEEVDTTHRFCSCISENNEPLLTNSVIIANCWKAMIENLEFMSNHITHRMKNSHQDHPILLRRSTPHLDGPIWRVSRLHDRAFPLQICNRILLRDTLKCPYKRKRSFPQRCSLFPTPSVSSGSSTTTKIITSQ